MTEAFIARRRLESGAGEEVVGEEGDATMRMSLAHRLEAMTDSSFTKAEGDAPADEACSSSPPGFKFGQRRPSVDRRGERENRRRSVDPSRVSTAAGGDGSHTTKRTSVGQDDDSGSSKVGMDARRQSLQARNTSVKSSVLGAALAAEGVSTVPSADGSRAPHTPRRATLCTPSSSHARGRSWGEELDKKEEVEDIWGQKGGGGGHLRHKTRVEVL